MKNAHDAWKQAQKLIPEFDRFSTFLEFIKDSRSVHIVALSPKSDMAFNNLVSAITEMKAALKTDARIEGSITDISR